MNRRTKLLDAGWVLCVLGAAAICSAAEAPKTLHEIMWVWGNPEMATPGQHGIDSFAQASPINRRSWLGACGRRSVR